MYVPALRHLAAADAGSPNFQLPARTPKDYGPRMDRFALAVIDFSLEALQHDPTLFDRFHYGENLILSRDDFLNPAASPVLNALIRISPLASRVATFSDLCKLPSREMPSLRAFRITVGGFVNPGIWSPTTPVSGYTTPFDVVDGMDYAATRKFVGNPVEIIGQVLQVKETPGLVLLRFGTKYTATPTVVMPRAVFARWTSAAQIHKQPWISAVGVLRVHRTGRYSTIQLLVKDVSDVEVLAGKDDAEFRLGRAAQPAPTPVAGPTGHPAQPPRGTPSPIKSTWKKAPDFGGGVPQWLASPSATSAQTQPSPSALLKPPSAPSSSRGFPGALPTSGSAALAKRDWIALARWLTGLVVVIGCILILAGIEDRNDHGGAPYVKLPTAAISLPPPKPPSPPLVAPNFTAPSVMPVPDVQLSKPLPKAILPMAPQGAPEPQPALQLLQRQTPRAEAVPSGRTVAPNAGSPTGNKSVCRRGYDQVGSECLPVAMPAGAELDSTGHKWVCLHGFYELGNECVPVLMPFDAELDLTGHQWVCRAGYYRAGNLCLQWATTPSTLR
jgi:hypothetical protein